MKGSTQKVCQLAGETDREFNQITVNQTETRVGLVGNDLGHSFEHNGKLFFLFGDSMPTATFSPVACLFYSREGKSEKEYLMKAPIRLIILILPLVMLMACLIAVPPASPPTGEAALTVPAPTATFLAPVARGLKMTRGIFIVTAHNAAIQPATYTNPAVDGIVIRTFWSNVQPAPDRFDWSLIDSQVQAASASGKKVILIVLPGAFTPQWALQGVQSAQFVVDYGFEQGTTVTLPMPWDATYLKRWFAFVQVLGQRYDSNPAVVNVPASGPTSISEEMSLPNDTTAVAKWKQLGYTLQKYEDAWHQTLAAYVQSFPTTQISLTFYPGLPIPDTSAEAATRVDVANFAFNNYGRHIAFQENGLSARKTAPSLGYDLVQQYSTKTTVGLEMGTSATEKPGQMGGNTAASALQASVDLGLKAGINFLEIYEKDELNPDLQSILANTESVLLR